MYSWKETFCNSVDVGINNYVTLGVGLLLVFSRLKLEIAQLNDVLTGLTFSYVAHVFFLGGGEVQPLETCGIFLTKRKVSRKIWVE